MKSILSICLLAIIVSQAAAQIAISAGSSIAADACAPLAISGASGPFRLTYAGADGPRCRFYTSSTCQGAPSASYSLAAAQTSTTIYAQCHMTYYLVITASLTDGSSTANTGPLVVNGTGGAAACGDPNIFGFDTNNFLFNGVAGKYYNYFSSPDVVLNTQLIAAGASGGPKGSATTVNGKVGVYTNNVDFEVDVSTYSANAGATPTIVITTTISGTSADAVYTEGQTQSPIGCVTVSFTKDTGARHHHHTIKITAPTLEVWIYVSQDNNQYIQGSYLDYFIIADISANNLGGVMAQTLPGNTNDGTTVGNNYAAYEVATLNAQGAGYATSDVCARDSSRKIYCRNQPHGHKCQFSNQCASDWCHHVARVCVPKGGCVSDADCTTGTTCQLGLCA